MYRQIKRYVANYKDGKWDEGTLTEDANIVMNECAGVLQYAQTVFEGMKAYYDRRWTYRYLSPGSECGAHGGFGKTFGNAGLSGRPIC